MSKNIFSKLKKIITGFVIFSLFSQSSFAATYTVTTHMSDGDQGEGRINCEADNPANPNCTIRAALTQAEANPGLDIIDVQSDIAGWISAVAGPLQVNSLVTIQGNGRRIGGTGNNREDELDEAIFNVFFRGSGSTITGFNADQIISGGIHNSELGIFIWDADNVTISDNVIGCNLAPCIDGNGIGILAGNADNLIIQDNVISGNTNWGVYLFGTKVDMEIFGNNIGTDVSGEVDIGNGMNGIYVMDQVDNLTIYDNVISGNGDSGIRFWNQDDLMTGLSIYGNKIGTDIDGMSEIPNDNDGITVAFAPVVEATDIGTVQIGNSSLSPNIISGNLYDGIAFGSGAELNEDNSLISGTIKIQNNYIGIGSDGIMSISNGAEGIAISGADVELPVNVVIGSDLNDITDNDEGNLIGFNANKGIWIQDFNSVLISHNKIGVSTNGLDSGYNADDAIAISGMQVDADYIRIINNVIGSVYDHPSIAVNNIADNEIDVVIQGNFIGIGMDGKSEIGGSGISVSSGVVTLGGVNNFNDMESYISDPEQGFTDQNFIDNAFDILGQGNIISNSLVGIEAGDDDDSGVVDLYVYGNIFGLARGEGMDFDTNAPNYLTNIYINSSFLNHLEIGAVDTTHLSSAYVGSYGFEDSSQLRNVIAGFDDTIESDSYKMIVINNMCDEGGLNCGDAPLALVNILNNYIGAAIGADGSQIDLSNPGDVEIKGIEINDGDQINIGCRQTGDGEFDVCDETSGNVISGNALFGIELFPTLNEDDIPGVVRILGNYIGTNPQGTEALPNGSGISVSRARFAYIGYTGEIDDSGAYNADPVQYSRNIVSGNNEVGIVLMPEDDEVPYFVVDILGNYIGVDVSGLLGLSNGVDNFYNGAFYGGGIFIYDIYGTNQEINIGGGSEIHEVPNVISGNYGVGIGIMSAKAGVYNIIGNYIGLDYEGNASEEVSNKAPAEHAINGSILWDYEGAGILLRSTEFMGIGEIRNVTIDGNMIANNEGGEIVIVNNGSTTSSVQDWTDGHITNNILGLDASGASALNSDMSAINIQNESGVDGLADLMIGLFENGVISGNTINGGMFLMNVETLTEEVLGDLYSANTWYDSSVYRTWVGYMQLAIPYEFYSHILLIDSDEIIDSRPIGTQCSDSIDNDEDGLVDLYDSDCDGVDDDSEGDPEVIDPETCTDFTYSEWGECVEGVKTRTATSALPEGCEGGSPVLSGSCGGGTLIITTPPLVCPAGTVKQGNTCVTAPKTCPTGFTLQGNDCVTNQVICTTGFTQSGNTCVPITCQIGYTLSGNTCVKTQTNKDPKQAANTITSHVSTSSGSSKSIIPIKEEQEDKKPLVEDCTTTEGTSDSNYNGIPDCLEMAFSLENVSSKEAADEFVFGLTGEEPILPSIVNLDGKTVGQMPLVLVTGKASTEVSLLIEEAETGKRLVLKNDFASDPSTGKMSQMKVTVVEEVKGKYADKEIEIGKTIIDKEYKGQISIENPLPVGKYHANLISNDGMNSEKVTFEVVKTDVEIEGLKVVEDKDPVVISVQPLVKTVLSAVEKADDSGRFVAEEYVDYRKEQAKSNRKYLISARINSLDKSKKLVYFTYKSVLYASVALSDVREEGETVNVLVPEYVTKGELHTLTMFVSNLEQTEISSKKSITFTME